MKKWLDDLYAILLRRGFNTLDNVLKKYKTEIEDFEEIKINNEVITLQTQEVHIVNISNYYNKYDRFTCFNRGNVGLKNFILYFYKYDDNSVIEYSRVNQYQNEIRLMVYDNKTLAVKNLTEEAIELDLYVKKLC